MEEYSQAFVIPWRVAALVGAHHAMSKYIEIQGGRDQTVVPGTYEYLFTLFDAAKERLHDAVPRAPLSSFP